jgi:hypothetical protein
VAVEAVDSLHLVRLAVRVEAVLITSQLAAQERQDKVTPVERAWFLVVNRAEVAVVLVLLGQAARAVMACQILFLARRLLTLAVEVVVQFLPVKARAELVVAQLEV